MRHALDLLTTTLAAYVLRCATALDIAVIVAATHGREAGLALAILFGAEMVGRKR